MTWCSNNKASRVYENPRRLFQTTELQDCPSEGFLCPRSCTASAVVKNKKLTSPRITNRGGEEWEGCIGGDVLLLN